MDLGGEVGGADEAVRGSSMRASAVQLNASLPVCSMIEKFNLFSKRFSFLLVTYAQRLKGWTYRRIFSSCSFPSYLVYRK